MANQEKIYIYGAGAIGSLIAARLALAGKDVTVVARRAHVDAITLHGLKLIEDGVEKIAIVKAVESIANLVPPSLVLVTLKAHTLPGAAEEIRNVARGAPVVFVVNGIPWWYFYSLADEPEKVLPRLDPNYALWRALDPSQVLGGIVHAPAELIAPGTVRSNGRNNRLLLGEPTGRITEQLLKTVGLLDGSCHQVIACPDFRTEVWRKLMVNLPTSLLCTLTQQRPCDILHNDAAKKLYKALVDEGQAVARTLDIILDIDVNEQIERSLKSRHSPSMLQDLLNDKPLEIDAQLRVVRDLANRGGVDISLIDALLTTLELKLDKK